MPMLSAGGGGQGGIAVVGWRSRAGRGTAGSLRWGELARAGLERRRGGGGAVEAIATCARRADVAYRRAGRPPLARRSVPRLPLEHVARGRGDAAVLGDDVLSLHVPRGRARAVRRRGQRGLCVHRR